MTRRRVVVTGLGIVSPVGIGVAAAWANDPRRRARASRAITRFDASAFPSRIAGEVKGFDVAQVPVGEGSAPLRHVHPLRPRRDDGGGRRRRPRRLRRRQGARRRVHRLGHRRPADDRGDARRATCDGGLRKISPFFVPGSIINMVAGPGVDPLRLQGPEPRDRVSACSTANHSIGEAARLIEYGDADVMVAGGAEGDGDRRSASAASAPRARCRTRNDDPGDGEPAVGRRPRRLRAGRGRRRAGARGIRAREGARRADLLRARRLRHERRRAPHHGAARGRRRRARAAC